MVRQKLQDSAATVNETAYYLKKIIQQKMGLNFNIEFKSGMVDRYVYCHLSESGCFLSIMQNSM
ncbi:hypothetical protein C0J52_19022 [Blattella germanica]|nr:hypothetical protein C0J52_19022 [Blattella germanica]